MSAISIANQSGAQVRAALNVALSKLQSNFVGPTDPAVPGEDTAGMLWIDTSANPATVKIRNLANNGWIDLGTFDSSFQLTGSTAYGRQLLAAANAAAAQGLIGVTPAINDGALTAASTTQPPTQASVIVYVAARLAELNFETTATVAAGSVQVGVSAFNVGGLNLAGYKFVDIEFQFFSSSANNWNGQINGVPFTALGLQSSEFAFGGKTIHLANGYDKDGVSYGVLNASNIITFGLSVGTFDSGNYWIYAR